MNRLEGRMQDGFGLTLQHVRRRMAAISPDSEVVTNSGAAAGRMSFREVAGRVDALAHALDRLGVGSADRVATISWNNRYHFELYMAVPCVGAVLHTVNVRLHPDQIEKILLAADDKVVFVQDSLVPLVAGIADRLDAVSAFVVMGKFEPGALPRSVAYDDLLAGSEGREYEYPELEEFSAAALCFTSGTTGDPKGVMFSHRSVSLHASSLLMADSVGLSGQDRVAAIVPMFHVNAWDLPYAAALAGSDLLLPDRDLTAASLLSFLKAEGATVIAGVPAVMLELVEACEREGSGLGDLRLCVCGGSAVPPVLTRRLRALGVEVRQAWGMTETSAISAVCAPPPGRIGRDPEKLITKQGRPLPWVEARIVSPEGDVLPEDGEALGELQVRGPWVAAGYWPDPVPEADPSVDGWFSTGDIGSVDELGYIELSDRTKDIVKSGGEWISSVELENHLMSHPEVAEAAVTARKDEKWGERPVAWVVFREGAKTAAADLGEQLEGLVPSWWVPDEFVEVDEIPKTSVGKFDKKLLRENPPAT